MAPPEQATLMTPSQAPPDQATRAVPGVAAPDQATRAVPTKAPPELLTQMAISQQPLSSSTPPPAPPPADYELRVGMQVGEYEVVRRIGEGGMGAVYSGIHPLIHRKVAIKVLNATASGADSASQRFLQEARAATKVRHPNIVDVFAFGQLRDGRSYLVMEFLEGTNLASHLEQRGALSFREAAPIIDGICAGLQAAHDQGIVHRDLKPENIWLCSGDSGPRVKLLDFGLAKFASGPEASDSKLTRAGMTLGTPAYMSPEQCRGDQELDHRSDIYSLGVVLYQIFSGRVPFRGDTYVEVLSQHLKAAPLSLQGEVGMPPDLWGVIARALAKWPDERYETVTELQRALKACALAEDFVPEVQGQSPSAASQRTAQVGAESASAASELLPFAWGMLRIEPQLGDGALEVRIGGELNSDECTERMAAYLNELAAVHVMPMREVERVVLDLHGLDGATPEATQFLAEWLGDLMALCGQGLAPATLRTSEGSFWQRMFAQRLQMSLPMLRVEEG